MNNDFKQRLDDMLTGNARYIIRREVNPGRTNLPDLLRELADDIDSDDFSESDVALMLFRDAEDGTLTFVFWGDAEDLLEQASRLHIKPGEKGT